MGKKFFLNSDDLKKIEQTVSSAEMRTSGEIVPMIVLSSNRYVWVPISLAVLGWVFSSFSLFAVLAFSPWSMTTLEIFIWQGLGIATFAVLGSLDFVKRIMVSEKAMTQFVDREALASFMTVGMTETKDRTGVLIYVSILEHRVKILADRGIHSKVPSDVWDSEVRQIIEGIKKGTAAEAICRSIQAIGEKLASNFPPREDDRDEISNKVRL